MARTTAPLLSFDARGQIAKTLVYATWRGVPYARRFVIPGNPRTTAQQLTRTTFATLREMWKVLGTDGRTPWTAFATGRPFLNLNAFIGENMRVVRGDPLYTDFLGSPGARGGLPPASAIGATGAGSGEVTMTFVLPVIPTGWVADNVIAVGFPDQDPALDFGGPMVVAAVASPGLVVTLTGLGSAVSSIVSGWIEWTKPNGSKAYSVSTTNTVTSGV